MVATMRIKNNDIEDDNEDDDGDVKEQGHLAGLLVGVGHQATHKVGLAVMLGKRRKVINLIEQNPTRVAISSVRETR